MVLDIALFERIFGQILELYLVYSKYFTMFLNTLQNVLTTYKQFLNVSRQDRSTVYWL